METVSPELMLSRKFPPELARKVLLVGWGKWAETEEIGTVGVIVISGVGVGRMDEDWVLPEES